MTPRTRWMVGITLLAMFLSGQLALLHHLHSAQHSLYAELKAPLEDLPAVLTDDGLQARWIWPRENKSLLTYCDSVCAKQIKDLDFKPDTFMLRFYRSEELKAQVYVNLVYSREGFDRRHHPEICLGQVMGLVEDTTERRRLRLPEGENGRPRPVQRFGFRGSSPLKVYYWHYTFRPEDEGRLSSLQFYHQLLRKAAPSVSVQVWLQETGSDVVERMQREQWVETRFLPALDAQLRSRHLPKRVEMNCDRVLMGLDR
jgi:hypothetical protein